MLLSAYRKDDWADPESAVAQLVIVLADYSDDVVNYVTDPRTGIQRRQTFPPSVAEVVKACDERQRTIEKEVEYAAWKEKRERSKQLQLEHGRSERQLTGMTYGEFLERFPGQRPIGRFEKEPV